MQKDSGIFKFAQRPVLTVSQKSALGFYLLDDGRSLHERLAIDSWSICF
jgi:hypothetical protein